MAAGDGDIPQHGQQVVDQAYVHTLVKEGEKYVDQGLDSPHARKQRDPQDGFTEGASPLSSRTRALSLRPPCSQAARPSRRIHRRCGASSLSSLSLTGCVFL